MLYNLYANQEMGRVENISGNAVIVFEAMKQIMALPYIEITVYESTRFYFFPHEMILSQIPLFIKTKKTLSRAIEELKDCDLILYNGVNRQPAYALSDKAISYITRATGASNVADGSSIEKNRKKPLFDLPKDTAVSALSREYYTLLKNHCYQMCDDRKMSRDEFGMFIDYHGSKGSKYKNYLRAFSTWLRNSKKWNKNSNGGESGTIKGRVI